MRLTGLILLVSLFQVSSFIAPTPTTAVAPTSRVVLLSSNSDGGEESESNTKKGGLEEGVRNKLLAESIAPWRTVRLFLYGSLGSGAFVGGLITLSGVAAALSGARSDIDLGVEYKNLAIDFGVVAAFVVAAKLDLDKQQELSEKVESKVAQKREQKKVTKRMQEREKRLSELMVEIQISRDGETKEAKIGEVQKGAKQHMIIVAGPSKACTEALIGANLLKTDFSMRNVLVVPYRTTQKSVEREKPSGGFGKRSSFETQPYVAQPCGEGWDEYITEEMDDAVMQAGGNVKEDGFALVVANNGRVIRRGVGTVPWRKMVDELAETVSAA